MTAIPGEDGAGDNREPVDSIVFVGGCERSGTTIVSRLLAEQLSLVVLPEAYFHAVAYRRFGADASAQVALRHWRRRSWGLETDNIADSTRLAPYLRDRMADIYESRRGRRTPLRVAESTPENIEIGSILLSEFPDSSLVHVIRDPRAVVASLRLADFGPTTIQECAQLWKQRVASGLAIELSQPDRVTRVRYEDCIADPASLSEVVPNISHDKNFSWKADRDLMVDQTSKHLQRRVQKPLDTSRIDSWRSTLSPKEIGATEFECRELMIAFGYHPDGEIDSRTATARLLDAARSDFGELTTGTLRRLLRVARASLRSSAVGP